MLLISTNASTSLRKRTRVNVVQSKTGCYTCKYEDHWLLPSKPQSNVPRARRIKCDETKPICIRCQRSGKPCDGYRHSDQASSLDTVSQHDALSLSGLTAKKLIRNISFGLQNDVSSQRYSRICLEVLVHDRYSTFSLNRDAIWIDILTQFSSINLAVSTALAAFGAVYDAVVLQRTFASLYLASAQYSKALTALHKDVALQSDGPIPSFLASVILAAAQVLQRHYSNSLTHLKGAFTVLTNTISPRIENGPKTGHVSTKTTKWDVKLYSFAQSLDLQTAWYALDRPPELPPSFDADVLNQFSGTNFLGCASHILQSLLHQCYHFASLASHYKYLPRSNFPTELALEQGRCIAYLSQWLAKCDDEFKAWSCSFLESNARQTYLILRVQCLSTLIYLSAISSPYESTYDTYTTYFQQIIQNAAEVLGNSLSSAPQSPMCHFRVQPGLAQALFLTSAKYRNNSQRRKAIELLSKVGMEGPWDPDILCKVARRAVEIEESRSLSSMMAKQDSGRSGLSLDMDRSAPFNVDVPEQHRLHGCAMVSEAGDFEANKPVSVHFSLCKNVEQMVRSDNHKSPQHWTIWTEPIVVGAGPFA
jgi:hypothetical protein